MEETDTTSRERFDTGFTRAGLRHTQVDEDPWGRLAASSELQTLLAKEVALDAVPVWAQEIVTRMIGSPLAPCGHYAFPAPVVQIIKAIGQERCPDFVMGCYTADPARKRRLQAIIYCLDAWLHGAPLETATWELERQHIDDKNWSTIVRSITTTLGDRHPLRVLLIERLIHRLRWWVKTHSWDNDARLQFGLDQYLGDPRGDGDWGDFGDPELSDPYFVELREPDIVTMEERIRTEVADGEALLVRIQSTWLCAPKAFRYIERVLLEIGAVGSTDTPDFNQRLLDCDDTYPDFEQAREWETTLLNKLASWLAGDSDAVPELGPVTPTKHWLAGLLRYRLMLMDDWSRFIGGHPTGHSGDATLAHL
jgi:hypothetical protein